jgi:hypothetical protein
MAWPVAAFGSSSRPRVTLTEPAASDATQNASVAHCPWQQRRRPRPRCRVGHGHAALRGRATIPATVDAPSSPGIFRPTIKPDKADACELSLSVSGPQVTESFPVGPCQVFSDAAAAGRRRSFST